MRIKYLPRDNEARVNNGICFYKGYPYVIGLTSETTATLTPVYRKRNFNPIPINLNDPDLDISAPTLGYVNGSSGVIYLMRRPARRYKQTLQADALIGHWINGDAARNDEIHSALYSARGEQMLLNSYPTLASAVEELKNGDKESIAIGKSTAIYKNPFTKEISVLQKNDHVGTLDLETLTLTLVESPFKWILKNELSNFGWKVT